MITVNDHTSLQRSPPLKDHSVYFPRVVAQGSAGEAGRASVWAEARAAPSAQGRGRARFAGRGRGRMRVAMCMCVCGNSHVFLWISM